MRMKYWEHSLHLKISLALLQKLLMPGKEKFLLCKSSLVGIDGHIHFEYVIPRMGKRVDVLLVIQNIIFIIEFKVGLMLMTLPQLHN